MLPGTPCCWNIRFIWLTLKSTALGDLRLILSAIQMHEVSINGKTSTGKRFVHLLLKVCRISKPIANSEPAWPKGFIRLIWLFLIGLGLRAASALPIITTWPVDSHSWSSLSISSLVAFLSASSRHHEAAPRHSNCASRNPSFTCTESLTSHQNLLNVSRATTGCVQCACPSRKSSLLLNMRSYLERLGVEVLAWTTERRPGRRSSRGRRNGKRPRSCLSALRTCCVLSSCQAGRRFFALDASLARRQGLTDTVKCFVPRREDEDLVTRLPLVSLCCSAFLLIVEPRSRAALSPDRRRASV